MLNSEDFYKFVYITNIYNKPNQKYNKIMINELIQTILNNTINSFDIPFCITVNIATYLLIKTFSNINFTTWHKRIVFLIVSIVIGIFYCVNGSDYKVILNSVILAPVSWSWIFKPICAKLKIDYNSKQKED